MVLKFAVISSPSCPLHTASSAVEAEQIKTSPDDVLFQMDPTSYPVPASAAVVGSAASV